MGMTSEQEARAKGLELSIKWSVGNGLRNKDDMQTRADEFTNYIAGYDVKKNAEGTR